MLNYEIYYIEGRHRETKRIRTVRVYSFAGEEKAREIALEKENLESIIEIRKVGDERPSDKQLNYARDLGIRIPPNACSEDVSALLDKKIQNDSEPKQGLIDFANEMEVPFSYYIGKQGLYNAIFSKLNDLDRIAFFIFCVYRFISDDREPNLNRSEHKAIFYEFAQSKVDDAAFKKSLLNYAGKDLRFFGKLKINAHTTLDGGNVNTKAFKEAREFLLFNGLIAVTQPYKEKTLPLIDPDSVEDGVVEIPPDPVVVDRPRRRFGCLSSFILILGISTLLKIL